MQHLEVSGAVRPLKWPLVVKWLIVGFQSSLALSGRDGVVQCSLGLPRYC